MESQNFTKSKKNVAKEVEDLLTVIINAVDQNAPIAKNPSITNKELSDLKGMTLVVIIIMRDHTSKIRTMDDKK